MLNKKDAERELRNLLYMMENKEETMKDHNLEDRDFYPYMFGWIKSEIKFILDRRS